MEHEIIELKTKAGIIKTDIDMLNKIAHTFGAITLVSAGFGIYEKSAFLIGVAVISGIKTTKMYIDSNKSKNECSSIERKIKYLKLKNKKLV